MLFENKIIISVFLNWQICHAFKLLLNNFSPFHVGGNADFLPLIWTWDAVMAHMAFSPLIIEVEITGMNWKHLDKNRSVYVNTLELCILDSTYTRLCLAIATQSFHWLKTYWCWKNITLQNPNWCAIMCLKCGSASRKKCNQHTIVASILWKKILKKLVLLMCWLL